VSRSKCEASSAWIPVESLLPDRTCSAQQTEGTTPPPIWKCVLVCILLLHLISFCRLPPSSCNSWYTLRQGNCLSLHSLPNTVPLLCPCHIVGFSGRSMSLAFCIVSCLIIAAVVLLPKMNIKGARSSFFSHSGLVLLNEIVISDLSPSCWDLHYVLKFKVVPVLN
jgi:hypothetical protein